MLLKHPSGRIVHYVENASELPSLEGVQTMYVDTETTGLHPYLGHRMGGIAILRDDEPTAHYVPFRHTNPRWNTVPEEAVLEWLGRLMQIPRWVNHNVKFDWHFFNVDGFRYNNELVDTYVWSRCFDSDRFTYGLKDLAREWCDIGVEDRDHVEAYLKGIKSENFMDVPGDILGLYAGIDVYRARALYKYLVENTPPEMNGVLETEKKITSVLAAMEARGALIDNGYLQTEKLKALRKIIDLNGRLSQMTGVTEFVDSNKSLFDLLANKRNLPILGYDYETGRPTFDGETLEKYLVHPAIDQESRDIISLILEYRTEVHFKGLFMDPYTDLQDENGFLHPNFNQVVRTGRMSCSEPNMQQLNPRAKSFIKPAPGNAIFRADASQVEFRLIVHYIQDEAAIEAYRNNPKTDFHQWVASICHIKRKPAKNINFGVGYGAGKKKVMAMIASNPDIIAEMSDKIKDIPDDKKMEHFTRLIQIRAEEIYNTYHERLPGIKQKSDLAASMARARGFVFNAFGRRRHLPATRAHIAFNSVIQSCAMDFIKTRMVELSPVFNPWLRDAGVHLILNVHDELVWEGPKDLLYSREFYSKVNTILEESPVPFRVPLMWNAGVSDKSWLQACEEKPILDADGKFIGGEIAH
mgnify:CR=1 FL=1